MTKIYAALLLLLAAACDTPTDAQLAEAQCVSVSDAFCRAAEACPNPKYAPADVYRLCFESMTSSCAAPRAPMTDEAAAACDDMMASATCLPDGEIVLDPSARACVRALVDRPQ